MLRGNHECRELTKIYNFLKECRWKYSIELYNEIMRAFDGLPLAALVTNQSGERVSQARMHVCSILIARAVLLCAWRHLALHHDAGGRVGD